MCADVEGGPIKGGAGDDLEGGGEAPGEQSSGPSASRVAEVTATSSCTGGSGRGGGEARPEAPSRV